MEAPEAAARAGGTGPWFGRKLGFEQGYGRGYHHGYQKCCDDNGVLAQRERQDKVLRELARPTFRKIGLSEYCRYVSAEDLHELLQKVKDLGGSVQSNVIERISTELDEIADTDESL
jgi:hypothetical protein